MKNLLYLFSALCLLVSCSDDSEELQNYTSFIVSIDDPQTFSNCIAAHKKDNVFYKIADLGDLTRGTFSPEIIVEDKTVKEVYIFTDFNGTVRSNIIFTLKNNVKNQFIVPYGTRGISVEDRNDPEQYPQS